jgi:hypothetical protein
MPNGADTEKPVEIAPNPWRGRTVSYSGLPKVRQFKFASSGRSLIAARGRATRQWPVRKTVEQFGAPVVRVTASSPTQWPHLVAVLTAVARNGSETVLSDGGAATRFGRRATTVTFGLVSAGNLIPRGAKLRLYLGATSTVQSIGNLLYLKFVPDDSRLSVPSVSLTLPVLPKTISR